MNHNLPITVLSWGIAFLPLVLLLIMLLGLQWSIVKSGFIALAATILTAAFAFKTPLQGILVALGRGAWNSVEIVFVIWMALLLYRVCLHAGAFEAVKESMKDISENYLFLILVIGWVFVSFLQGVAGFGTPVAIVAPILIGLGIKPAFAVIIPLVAQGWSNLFGALGIAWTVTTGLVNIDSEPLTILYSTILLGIAALTSGFFIAWLYAGWNGIKEGWLLILVASVLMGGGQAITAQWNALLGVIIPTFITLGVMLLFTKLDRFKQPSPYQDDSPILDLDSAEEESDFKNTGALTLNQALVPFYVLTVLSVIAVGVPGISNVLSQIEIPGFNFPGVETGYSYVTQSVQNFSPVAIFTNPTVYLLLSSIIGYFWYKSKGCYKNSENLRKNIGKGIISNSISPALSILAFLMLSQLLLISGQNTVLALGISSVASPVVYAAISPWIGASSVFMTSSTVAGNTLFAPLQQSVVQTMPSLSMNQMIANQSSGSSIANAVGPSNVVLGASTSDAENQTGIIYRYGFIYVIITCIIFSLAAVLMHLLFP